MTRTQITLTPSLRAFSMNRVPTSSIAVASAVCAPLGGRLPRANFQFFSSSIDSKSLGWLD